VAQRQELLRPKCAVAEMIELISNELIIFITVPSESDVLTELKIFHIFEFF
jgi:hypothetical protein